MKAYHRRLAAITLILAATRMVGCATMGERISPPLVPTKFQTRTGPFVVFTNEPIPADAGVIKQLHALEDEFTTTLDVNVTKVEQPIEVYLLTDRKSFEHFLTFYYPELPQRRAFFLGQGERRVIYTYVSEKLDIDIRHEATHALLSVAFGDLPLWLDEGLAEYFECPGEVRSNPENLRRIASEVSEGWKPDISRLESLKAVKDMTPRDYHESWTWVHMALSGTAQEKKAFRAFLVQQSHPMDGQTQSFLTVLTENPAEDPNARFVSHIQSVRDDELARTSAPAATTPAQKVAKEPVIRLQEPMIEPVARPNKPRPRKGVFGKFREFVFGPSEKTESPFP